MGKWKGDYRPRSVDRAIFSILAAVLILSGGYVIGPWYLTQDGDSSAPLYNLFENQTVVVVFGTALMIVGGFLVYCAIVKGGTRRYTQIVSYTLLSAFLLRLYSLIGVALALESWRPPGYLSHAATVAIFAAYYVWVRVNVRLAE